MTTPPCGRSGSATAPTSRTGASRPESSELWPYVGELFETDELVAGLAATRIAVDPAELGEPVTSYVDGVLAQATLTRPSDGHHHSGGRRGVHTEQMGYLLAEMQHLARSHPGATW